jgi:RES domain-containing protein
MTVDIPVRGLHWKRSWRVINTRYPEISLFSRISSAEDEPTLLQLEQLTNNRTRQMKGEINRLRTGDFFPKRCSPDLMAPFVYRIPGRFSDHRFGAYYTANSIRTAAFEKAHHYMKLLSDAGFGPLSAQMRVIRSQVEAAVHDIRGLQHKIRHLYHPIDYTDSQAWAHGLWLSNSQGIVYSSVRDPEGQCVAIFSPQTIRNCHKDRILQFEWDGQHTIRIDALQEFLIFKN